MPVPPGEPKASAASAASDGLHVDDLRLTRAAVGGAAQARSQVAQRLQCVPKFVGSINRRHGDPLGEHERADLAQDAATTAWRRLATFEGRSALETWVYRIVTFEFLNAARRKQGRKVRTEADFADTKQATLESSSLDHAPERYEELHAGIAGLAPEAQAVIDLKHYGNQTFEQIAQRLSLSPSAVKRLYYGALKELKARLESHAQ